MPSPLRAPSSEPTCVLLAAPSGRALAQAARAAGYRPLVADFFDDLDTRELAAANCLVEGEFERGFESDALIAALTALSAGRQPIGLVYGAGFEDRVDLLRQLADRWPLLGNLPSVVAQVKAPQALADMCRALGIPHPDIRFETPSDVENWLVKQAGGSGGVHIGAVDQASLASGAYYQRRVTGIAISAMLLADTHKVEIVGFSEQWSSPAPRQPWRFGGCARPARLDAILHEKLARAARAIAEAIHLIGLNSIDFLVDGQEFHLLEINPRPGASLDIFHDLDGRLLKAHIEACQGHLPQAPLRFEAAEAAAFVYAPHAIASLPAYDWPDWAADRQKPRSAVAENDPLCTVLANGPDLATARHRLEERSAYILSLLSPTQKEAAA